MTTYAERVCSFGSCLEQNSLVYPEMFRSVYSAIQMAGDQGLCMKDISRILKMQDKKLSEAVIEVLEAFGRVLKVNAYDSIRVVDSLYRSKYFLIPVAAIHEDATSSPYEDCEAKTYEESATHNGENHKDVELQNSDKVHKVTILNLPKAVAEPSSKKQTINEAKGCRPTEASSPTRNHPEEPYDIRSTGLHLCKPILPWLNGDGTTNERVYKGLVRRVLGIVMQNPGIKEGDIICHMHVLNPQSCRSLLNMMILDNVIFSRKIPQANPSGEPAILSSLIGSHFKKSKLVSREHFFANPSSTHLL
uniref:Transcription factor n=2 Tax=Solanum tuberosum TaxID=4113 RepID=M1AHF5_SOLTU